jgi:hypothetical protein
MSAPDLFASPDLEIRVEPIADGVAICPAFVPHSGEIVGDWIGSNERFTNPRLPSACSSADL